MLCDNDIDIDNDDITPQTQNDCANNNLIDLHLPFALIPQIIDKYETRFRGVQQSELYKPTGLIIPKLPIYHPYHPFKNVTHDLDMLQVPLAMILPNTDLVPRPLLKFITGRNINATITPYFLAQTLPYDSETEVICRYQYCLFPDATSEMIGHQSIWAQSFIYKHDNELVNVNPTAIKIYESEKNSMSPTILCGNSMKFDHVSNLRGRGIWSLVFGSNIDTVDDVGLFAEISHAFLGFTYFIPDGNAYTEFLISLRNKTPAEIIAFIPSLELSGQTEYGQSHGKVEIV